MHMPACPRAGTVGTCFEDVRAGPRRSALCVGTVLLGCGWGGPVAVSSASPCGSIRWCAFAGHALAGGVSLGCRRLSPGRGPVAAVASAGLLEAAVSCVAPSAVSGWGELGAVVVDVSVASVAQQGEVIQRSGAAVGPEPDVVGVAPAGGGGAADTARIAHGQCFAHRGGHRPGGAADVEGLGCPVGDHPADRGVAGPHACGRLRNRAHAVEQRGRRACLPPQRIQGDHHGDVGLLATHVRQGAARRCLPQHLDQRICTTLVRGALIVGS